MMIVSVASEVAFTAIPVKQYVVPSMHTYPSSVRVHASAVCIDVMTASQFRAEIMASIAARSVHVVVGVPGKAATVNALVANNTKERNMVSNTKRVTGVVWGWGLEGRGVPVFI
jgi:hypothetical protein